VPRKQSLFICGLPAQGFENVCGFLGKCVLPKLDGEIMCVDIGPRQRPCVWQAFASQGPAGVYISVTVINSFQRLFFACAAGVPAAAGVYISVTVNKELSTLF
jgi:hypothetical protein